MEQLETELIDGNAEDLLFDNIWSLFDAASEGLEKAPKDSLTQEAPLEEGAAAYIDVEDFEGPEQFLFTVLKSYVRDACNVNTSWPARKKAAEWIFCSTVPDARGIAFAETCRVFGARRTVLQARVHYQLYWAGVPYQEPLPFLCDSLPEPLYGEILLGSGEDATLLAKYLWTWPGVRADVLAREAEARFGFSSDRTLELMTRMEKSGHAALKHGFWFFISRNPDVYSAAGRRRFQWSKAFVGPFV